MADSKNDITTEVNMTDTERLDLKKTQYQENSNTRLPEPAQVSPLPRGLVSELVEQLKIGRKSSMFNGIERCIRVLEPGTPNQRHCYSMMVNNLTMNQRMCSQCDRIRDVNARPTVINSSMIKLTQKDLDEMHMDKDPNYRKPGTEAPKEEAAIKPAKKVKKVNTGVDIERPKKRTSMKTPSKIVIEMNMADLKTAPNVLNIMLEKALEAIFELPVSNFREAEEIRVVKERVEKFLQEGKA